MTTLNGLPRSWDSFIQGICARRKLIYFNRLREECKQEGDQLVIREDKDQSLIAHTRKNDKKKENHHHNKKKEKNKKK